MKGDALASGQKSAVFLGGSPKAGDPIEFHGTVATEEVPAEVRDEEATCIHGVNSERTCVLCKESATAAPYIPRVIDWSKYQPMNDRVLLRRIEEKDESLIQLPDAFVLDSDLGEVLAVGEGMMIGGELRPINLQPGDKVRFGHYNAEEITVEGTKLILISAFDVRLKIRS